MNTVHEARIKQLTVGGFQSFAGPISVPFGPLTLIYGPNSAGKSALLDAMHALSELCDLYSSSAGPRKTEKRTSAQTLARHWRREGSFVAAPVPELTLGTVIRVAGDIWARSGFAESNNPSGYAFPSRALVSRDARFASIFAQLQPLLASSIEISVSFRYRLSDPTRTLADGRIAIDSEFIEVGLNGLPLLQWEVYGVYLGEARLKLDHPALLSWEGARDLIWLGKRAAVAGQSDLMHLHEENWFTMRLCTLNAGELWTHAIDELIRLSRDDVNEEDNDRKWAAGHAFLAAFEGLFLSSLNAVHTTLALQTVPASRSVPRNSEVTFIFDGDGRRLSGQRRALSAYGLSEHEEITRSAFLVEMARDEPPNIPPWHQAHDENPRNLRTADPLMLINRLLANYLFGSAGYFVAASVRELVPLCRPSAPESPQAKSACEYVVTLELRDSIGRHFDFDEVGSGLGYVLPVLLAIATSSRVFLQQPELHLHPALQSELADAIAVSLNDSAFGGATLTWRRQIIAETHSEHLLLRLLRRVRQATIPERSLDPHSLGREDIVVLYVDPLPDGSSTVKHLRIAKDGEFIDRWPSGFFEERWKELFGE